MIELSISDDGVGMTKSQIRKLVSKQYESNRTDSYGLRNMLGQLHILRILADCSSL